MLADWMSWYTDDDFIPPNVRNHDRTGTDDRTLRNCQATVSSGDYDRPYSDRYTVTDVDAVG